MHGGYSQVGEKQGRDLGSSDDVGKLAREDHRRLNGADACKLAAEVAPVSGDECEPVGSRFGEHLWVAGTGHAKFANVDGMMPSGDQQWTDSGREVLIDQEPHAGG